MYVGFYIPEGLISQSTSSHLRETEPKPIVKRTFTGLGSDPFISLLLYTDSKIAPPKPPIPVSNKLVVVVDQLSTTAQTDLQLLDSFYCNLIEIEIHLVWTLPEAFFEIPLRNDKSGFSTSFLNGI